MKYKVLHSWTLLERISRSLTSKSVKLKVMTKFKFRKKPPLTALLMKLYTWIPIIRNQIVRKIFPKKSKRKNLNKPCSLILLTSLNSSENYHPMTSSTSQLKLSEIPSSFFLLAFAKKISILEYLKQKHIQHYVVPDREIPIKIVIRRLPISTDLELSIKKIKF